MNDIQISKAIVELRVKAGLCPFTCPTCGRGTSTPFRYRDSTGYTMEGCIDAFHTVYFAEKDGSDADWHNRKTAKAIRRIVLRDLTVLLRD